MQSADLIGIFIGPLEKSGLSYFVTGSIASIFYGEPRLTHDIDVVVHLSREDFSQFNILFPIQHFYCPPVEVIEIESRRRPFGHFNLIHHQSGTKADIYPDSEDSLYLWAFKNRQRVDLGGKLAIWLAPPEYVIIRKLEFFREGGSQKHLDDIRKMLPQVKLDVCYFDQQIVTRDLLKYWNRITETD